jgi:thiamine pyrophosphokinase
MERKKAFIYTGGTVFDEYVIERPEATDLIIAADAGYLTAQRMGITPDVLLGDFDTLGTENIPEGIECLRMPAEKDDTDTQLAVQVALERGATEIVIVGGLGGRVDNFPAQLSGGEQQRVSIARALAKNPKLLLCDEPTGALDYNTGKAILKLLQDTCREQGMTVILITHNSAIAPMADRVIHIKNGRVAKVIENENPVPVETIEW